MKRLVLVCLFALSAMLSSVPAHAMKIERVVSPGGIEAWLVEEHAVPVLVMNVGWRGAGATQDPKGRPGVAYLVSGLLDEGAGKLDSRAFQEALDDKAIGMSFDADKDSFSATLKTLNENRDRAFDLFRLALAEPRFDPEAIERVRAQVISILASERDDPNSMASQAWYAAAFPGHPYGLPLKGTPETVRAITRDDLASFAKRVIARDNMKISVVGPITPAELAPLLDRLFGTLPATARLVPVADVKVAAAPKQPVVIPQDNPQSVVLFGEQGLARADPDFIPAFVMNYMLGGGGFTSRFMDEVREKRGLAYGVSSYLYPFDHGAIWIGQYGTRNEKAGQSLAIIRREMSRMADRPVSVGELKDAQTFLTGSYPLRFDSNAGIAAQLLQIQMENLGIDYVERRNALVEAVTPADIGRVARRLMKPDDLLVVAVGKPNFADQSIPPATERKQIRPAGLPSETMP